MAAAAAARAVSVEDPASKRSGCDLDMIASFSSADDDDAPFAALFIAVWLILLFMMTALLVLLLVLGIV